MVPNPAIENDKKGDYYLFFLQGLEKIGEIQNIRRGQLCMGIKKKKKNLKLKA